MNGSELIELLQKTYFDNVDSARPEQAVCAFAPKVHWQHTQVWAHDGHDARHTDIIHSAAELESFLRERVVQMQEIQIKHVVDEAVVEGGRGAFRARVIGPTGRSLAFLGWVEIADGKIQKYIVSPERMSA